MKKRYQKNIRKNSKIPIEKFDIRTISFTYGDSHPTFSDRVNDGKEYRKKLYTYDEILEVIKKYGLPQEWNDDGKYGVFQAVFQFSVLLLVPSIGLVHCIDSR